MPKCGTLRIVGVGLNPTIVRREPRANRAVDKCLNSSSGGSVLLGRENFTVRVTKEYEVIINLLEDPAGRTARKSTIETEFILRE